MNDTEIRLYILKAYFATKDSKHKSFHTEYHCKKKFINHILYGPITVIKEEYKYLFENDS